MRAPVSRARGWGLSGRSVQKVVGAASIVDRSGGAVRFDVPLVSLLHVSLPAYEPEACPLCADGVAIVKPGSRPVVV